MSKSNNIVIMFSLYVLETNILFLNCVVRFEIKQLENVCAFVFSIKYMNAKRYFCYVSF